MTKSPAPDSTDKQLDGREVELILRNLNLSIERIDYINGSTNWSIEEQAIAEAKEALLRWHNRKVAERQKSINPEVANVVNELQHMTVGALADSLKFGGLPLVTGKFERDGQQFIIQVRPA